MAYEVEFTKRAAAYIKRLDAVTKRRVHQSVMELAEQGLEASNLKRMQGDPFFRKRLGDLRILFQIDVEQNRLLIADIGPRGDFYKNR